VLGSMMSMLTDAEPGWEGWLASSGFVAHLALQVGVAIRVVMQRRRAGETLAWLLVVTLLPVVGLVLYFTIGELRLGARRERRFVELVKPVRKWAENIPESALVDWAALEADYKPMAMLCERTLGLPALAHNKVELIHSWEPAFEQIVADVDAATSTCHLEFYIWAEGGAADGVADALIRAVTRGVVCRVLVDALGSHDFLKSGVCMRLRAGGVDVHAALPGSFLRMPFVRYDLRLHRKIVVIDGQVAYTGSLNMVDPRGFKQDAGVGQWVDAMARIEGPVVQALQITLLGDWFVETDATIEQLRETGDVHPQPEHGECVVQVMPSGPGDEPNAVEQVLITAIYSARHELVLTTPYFVPSEPLSMALVAAARRGVAVTLIIPEHVDSILVRYASNAFKADLLQAGVEIALFSDGLLHTKSVTVDGTHSLFGSVNLDPRSFRLNFEVLLAIYDETFTTQLRAMQQDYLDRSERMDLELFRKRPRLGRVAEDFARLVGPLL
jgi:cardiolipin synthase